MSNQKLSSEIGTPTRKPEYGESWFREHVSNALKHCSKRMTREQVAQELTTMTGHTITKGMLDDWATPSKTGLRVPAFLIKPLCEVTGDDRLQRWVSGPRLQEFIEIGEQLHTIEPILGQMHGAALKLKAQARCKMTPKKQTRKA